jgi:DNA-binding Xre family transcriptional regulator
MIKLRVKQLLEMKGEKFPRKAMVRLGISEKVATKYLKSAKEEIGLQHMEWMCLFFRCEPSELFEWVPDRPGENDPTQPLQKLKPKKRLNTTELLKKMTPDEIRKRLLGEEEGK